LFVAKGEEVATVLLSQHTNAAIRRLWQCFSEDALSPASAIRQLAYLLLLKLCEEEAATCSLKGPGSPWPDGRDQDGASWSRLRGASSQERASLLGGAVAGWVQRTAQQAGLPPAALSLSKPHLVAEVLELIDTLFPSPWTPPLWGSVFDALMQASERDSATWAQRGGQFFTPHHLGCLLADLVHPRPGEAIADLSCGNGRLLASAFAHLLAGFCDPEALDYRADGRPLTALSPLALSGEQRRLLAATRLVGVDIDAGAVLLALVHLRCMGAGGAHLEVADALGDDCHRRLWPEGLFDVVLGNPPFGSAVDLAQIGESLRPLGTKKPEALFLELALQALRPGGRAALIVPDGVLFNREKAFRSLRGRLLDENCLHAVISLPAGVFLPYAGVKTSILVFSRGGHTGDVWFYKVGAEGYSLDTARAAQVERNDLPDLVAKYWLRWQWGRAGETSAGWGRSAAFLDADTRSNWEGVPPERLSLHCAAPLLMHEAHADSEGRWVPVWVFRGSSARPLDPGERPKDWLVARARLAEGDILSPERYEPDPSTLPAGAGRVVGAGRAHPGGAVVAREGAAHAAVTDLPPEVSRVAPPGEGRRDSAPSHEEAPAEVARQGDPGDGSPGVGGSKPPAPSPRTSDHPGPRQTSLWEV
jgi:type I restriction enzyme M protein